MEPRVGLSDPRGSPSKTGHSTSRSYFFTHTFSDTAGCPSLQNTAVVKGKCKEKDEELVSSFTAAHLN